MRYHMAEFIDNIKDCIHKEMQNKFDITVFESINKGLSHDRKYYIETTKNLQMLLRVSDAAKYEQIKADFEKMQRMYMEGIPMPQPLELGFCNDDKRVYQLQTWCEGENLEAILPMLTETEQYVTGLKVGEILRKIHIVPAPENIENWQKRYINVISERLQAYHDCGVRFEGWENIIRYYNDNLHLLRERPQTCLHGDYHAENLLRDENGNISVIDWQILDFSGYGDPWVDFRSDQCASSPHFATGFVRGYFNSEPTIDFWKLQALYMATGSITAIPWAFYRYPAELDSLVEHNLNILLWFDNMSNPVPSWYLKDFYIQEKINSLPAMT